jgi:branched-chain amino acid transport system substrate-binding protein
VGHCSIKRLSLVMTSGALTVASIAFVNSTDSSAATSKAHVQIDMFVPLTGPSGSIGLTADVPGFLAAQQAINSEGGILGRQLDLIQTDLGADPADSVAAAREMLARYPKLSGVVGLTSDTAIVSAQIFNSDKMVTMTQSGTTQLDHVHYKYVFRDYPSDSSLSVAMTAAALSQGYKRAAILFGENAGSQENVAPMVKLYTSHGGKVVVNEPLPLDQTSYDTEIAKALSSNPQVILYETDSQTAATLFSELKTLEAGKVIPVIGTSFLSNLAWLTPVANAVGGFAKLGQEVHFLATPTNPPNSAYPGFLAALKKVEKHPNTYNNSYVADNYDSVIIEALAMDLANSTNPQVYVKDLTKVTNNHQGKRVTTYSQGLAAIKAHEPFFYATTMGSMYFNQYHSVIGSWDIANTSAAGKIVTTKVISDATLAKYS